MGTGLFVGRINITDVLIFFLMEETDDDSLRDQVKMALTI